MEFLQQKNTLVMLGFSLSLVVLMLGARRALTVKQVSYLTDSSFASFSQIILTSNLSDPVKKRFTCNQILEHAQALIPAVGIVQVNYSANRLAKLKIIAQKPVALVKCVDDDRPNLVITKQGSCIDRIYFAQELLENLLIIKYAQTREQLSFEKYNEKKIIRDIALSSLEKLKTFDIFWDSRFEVKLISKIDSYQVVLHPHQITDIKNLEKKLNYIKQIYLDKKNSDDKKWRKGLRSDIRIRDRIIIRPLR